jgi:hypothetical protein
MISEKGAIMDQYTKDAQDVAEAMGKEYMESMFVGTHRFYADIEFLVDFRLTAVLCLMTKKDYGIIKKNMQQYNARTDNETVKYFPKLSVTEEAIDTFLAEPNLSALSVRLQYTTYMEQFLDLLRGTNNRNHLSSSTNERFEVQIGCNNLPLPTIHRQHIVDRISGYVGENVSIQITRDGICDYSSQAVARIQHFSLYDFENVVNTKTFAEHISTGLFFGRTISAFPFIPKPDEDLTKEELLISTIHTLNWFFDFEYITTKVQHGKE